MKVAAIGQGFGIVNESVSEMLTSGSSVLDEPPTTVGEVVLASIYDKAFNEAQFIVAFATETGASTIINAIEDSSLENVDYFIGTDQEATTEQALEVLLKSDLSVSWIRFRSSDTTFHPKVYLFKGPEKIRLIIGSANVTNPGLEKNVEAGMIYEVNRHEEDDLGPIADIENSLLGPLQKKSSPLTESAIQQLKEQGYIGDEEQRSFSSTDPETSSSTPEGSENESLGVTTGTTARDLSALINAGDEEPDSKPSGTADRKRLPTRAELPPIPEVEEFPKETDRRFYNRLCRGTDNQPSLMRRIIFEEGKITQGELKRRLIENHGYDDSGSLDASLRVLWRTTDEIDKEGEGPNAQLVWTRTR
ncbi:phospholipase D family protein [Halosimplex amylolyticum]|uniref:phospholipase D family protein n=1 Tax=Halosimplex amylolyticum TaxID=3396616 RepID=UPI003F550C89